MRTQQWKRVDRETWARFVKEYPRPTHSQWHLMCEPAMHSFDDFTLGTWPESMVARSFENSNDYDIDLSAFPEFETIAGVEG